MKHKRIRIVVITLSVLGLASGCGHFSTVGGAQGPRGPASQASVKGVLDLGGVRSPRTLAIDALVAHWPPRDLSRQIASEDRPVRIRTWTTPGNDLYMGIEQTLTIGASLEKVEAVLDDFGRYQEIFPDYKDVHVVSRQGDRVRVSWEQKVPLFFVPNVRYETVYEMDKSLPDRRVYRYQLWKQGQLRYSDGLIVLERRIKIGKPESTFYFELDFFDADWGPAKMLGRDKLWRKTVDGLFLSDVAVKLKAENPKWSDERIRDESSRELDRKEVRSRIDAAIRERRPYPLEPSQPGAVGSGVTERF